MMKKLMFLLILFGFFGFSCVQLDAAMLGLRSDSKKTRAIICMGFDDHKAFMHYGSSSTRLEMVRNFCKEIKSFMKFRCRDSYYYGFVKTLQHYLTYDPKIIHRVAEVYFGLLKEKGESLESVIDGLIRSFEFVHYNLAKVRFVFSKSLGRNKCDD